MPDYVITIKSDSEVPVKDADWVGSLLVARYLGSFVKNLVTSITVVWGHDRVDYVLALTTLLDSDVYKITFERTHHYPLANVTNPFRLSSGYYGRPNLVTNWEEQKKIIMRELPLFLVPIVGRLTVQVDRRHPGAQVLLHT